MKIIIILLSIVLFLSCMNINDCSHKNNYIARIDTLKSFSIKGIYCYSVIEENKEKDSCVIKINVFSRITGKVLDSGVVSFVKNDTNKIVFNKSPIVKKIKKTDFSIWLWEAKHDDLLIKKVKVKDESVIEFNVYLGATTQF
jgi:hypothetical protein